MTNTLATTCSNFHAGLDDGPTESTQSKHQQHGSGNWTGPERRAGVPGGGHLLKLFAMIVVCLGLATGSVSLLAAEPAAAMQPTSVNINAADAATLAAGLKGVGEARAREIVRYREMYGPFASPDELTEVKGIGQSTLDMNRQLITLE